jgi:two-component system nitrate/nitrite response regulator NarL
MTTEAVPWQGAQVVSENRIKVLIADDHPLIVAGIRRGLEGEDDIEVVGEAHTGPELMQLIERRRPTMVLLDLRMPGVAGVEGIERIGETWPDVEIVVLSACDDRASIDAALSAGASSYVVKSVKPIDLASVLRQSSMRGVFHAGSDLRAVASDEHAPRTQSLLTERERTILDAVASGLTTAAISSQLWVSEHTVKFHLTNIYRKLGVANRAGAIRYALEHRSAA